MRKALPGPRIVWKIAYVALSALLTLSAVIYFANLQASAAAPQVAFERDGTDVTATATPSGSDELKFLRADSEQYWNWNVVDNASECNASDFGSSDRQALRDGTNDAVTMTITNVNADQHLCLKVLYGSSGSQQFREFYASFLFDTTAPVIEISQQGLSLTASSDDPSGIKVWDSYLNAADPVNCSDSTDADNAPSISGSNHYTLTLTDAQDNYFYCFRAEDNQGNVAYSAIEQVDTVAPNLMAEQPDESATVTLTVSQDDDDDDNTVEDNSDVDVDSWQYVQTTQACDNVGNWRDLDTLTNDLDQDQAAITFSRSAVGRTYCFRVADDAGNYATAQHKVTAINEPPVINRLYQNKQSVVATATDRQYLNSASWQYAVTNDADCDSSITGWHDLGTAFSSDSNRNQATLDLTEADIDESSDNKWLCVRVSDNVTGNYGYRSLDIDALAPTINVQQDNAVLRASAPSADRAVSSSWRYVRHTSSFDCDEDAFELYTPIRSGSRVNLRSSDIGDYFCFRADDSHDNYGYSNAYRVRSLDTVAPEITATQDNRYLTLEAAASENVDHDTWGYAPGYSSRPDCEDVDDYLYETVEDRTIDLDEGDVGDWFCIRAADDSDNYGYHSIRIRAVDATAPRVTVDREDNTLEASTTAEDVNDASWQYAVSETNDRFNCDDSNDDLDFNNASSANNMVELGEEDDDKYYCFRVADKAGNYGYGRSEQIYDVEPAPKITVIQHTAEKRLEVSTDATDVDGLTWGWADFTTDPGDCSSVRYTDISHSQITTNTRRIFVNNIADTQNSKYYCFRVADTSDVYGTNYGYGKHRYDLTAPSIRFELANNVLTVVSDDKDVDAASWAYAKFDQAVDCEGATIGQALPYRKVTLSEADNGSYLCFKVADENGNSARVRYQVAGVEDDSIPVIDITQSKYAIIATSADRDINASTWRYALAPSEPYCDLGHKLTLVKNSGALNKVDLTKVSKTYTWVCFEVADKNGNKGFAKIEIDRQAPTILIQQNNVVLVVESEDEDLNPRSWAYAKGDSADCAGESFTKLDFSSKKISFDLTAADNGKYFCFKVADKAGNEASDSTRVDQIDVSAPVVRLSQDNNVLSASATNVDASSWAYARSKSDLNCSGEGSLVFGDAASSNAHLVLSADDNGYWYCFKVRSNNGVDGYAKILVDNIDTRAPRVKTVQKGDIVLATAGESVASWHYVVLPGGKCGPDAFDSAAQVNLGNQVTVDATDDGLVYCFRATDTSGNTGYDSVRVKIKTAVTTGTTTGTTTTTTTTDTGSTTTPDDDDDEVPGLDDDDSTTVLDDDDEGEEDDDDEGTVLDDDDNGIGTRGWLIAAAAAVILIAIIVLIVWASKGKGSDDNGSDNVDYV